MNRATSNSQSRFVHRLGQSRVRKAGQGKIFCAGTEFHGNHALGNDFRRLWTYDMEAQNTVGLRVCNDLDHAASRIRSHGTTIGRKREGAHVILFTLGLQLLFGLTNPGNFRCGVDDVRNAVIVDLRLVTGNTLRNHHAFFRRFVCQHWTTNDIAYSPNAWRFRFAVVIDEDEPALVQLDPGIFGQQPVGVGTTANSHNQLVKLGFLFALGVFVVHVHQLALYFRTGHSGTGDDVQALFLELLQRIFGNLLIDDRQEGILSFQDGHFRTQPGPDTAELKPDNTGTNNTKALGYFSELHCTFRIDNVVTVEGSRRDLNWLGATGQNDIVSFVGLGFTVFVGYLNLATGQQFAVAMNRCDTIGLEQATDATGQLFNDTRLTLHHFGNVDFNAFCHNTHGLVIVTGFLKFVSNFQQCLGWDAAHVQTGTAQHLALTVFRCPGFDTGSLQTQLSRFDSRNISTGASTNDNNVVLIGHNLSCSQIR